MLQWRECLLISSVHLFQATFITLYSYTSVIQFKQLLSLLCACCLIFLKRLITYPQKPFSFCKMQLSWAKPIPERRSPVTGPGAGPRWPISSYTSWHSPALANQHLPDSASTQCRNNRARTVPNTQLRHSHAAVESRTEGCRAGLAHTGVPGLEYCGLSFQSHTFTHVIIPAVLLCTYSTGKKSIKPAFSASQTPILFSVIYNKRTFSSEQIFLLVLKFPILHFVLSNLTHFYYWSLQDNLVPYYVLSLSSSVLTNYPNLCHQCI